MSKIAPGSRLLSHAMLGAVQQMGKHNQPMATAKLYMSSGMIRPLLSTQPLCIWHHVFGRHAALDVEIGFGHGNFLIQRARNYPQRNLVGIEYKAYLVRKAMRRKAQQRLHNLHILQGDAHSLIATAFAVGEIHHVFMNFPDPWWKKRHIKRRILTPMFVQLLADKSVATAQIFLQTDVLMTFTQCLQQLQQHNIWRAAHNKSNPLQVSNTTKAVSRRERRCIQQQIPIYRAVVAKN
ncbi:MAG: tRNA (guanosine(46)-N7)-methyltransferase TrmB [Myxococcota bacterium]